jgi:hypothetical protein
MAADKSVRVEIHGVRDLQKALKQMDTGMEKALKNEFLDIAESVASGVRSKVVKGPTGRASASVKARASNRGASIAVGGTKAPYYPWLDFGGSVGRGHQPGKPWSGAIRRDWKGVPVGKGRWLYPTITEHRDDIVDQTDDALERLARQAGFETEGSL